ncbi:hypothetical protein [Nocardia niwae]|uniref:Uncharacterized protein n=1 Tax=Nocardia niwae TaxID=626084 RepID=A0ABV2XJ89_9NOCA
MNADELGSVVEWATHHRQQFHLPARERGRYIMLPFTNEVGIVHAPKAQAVAVLAPLQQ